MNNCIYYPNFEFENEGWLKFALLYVDKFRPIIPDVRKNVLSDLYKKIIYETELINPIEPTYIDRENAHLNTCDFLIDLFKNKDKQKIFFKDSESFNNWQKSEKKFLIFNEKINSKFTNFCLEHKLCEKSNDGIFLPEEIYHIYMTNLAKSLSESNDYGTITDKLKYSNFNNFSKGINSNSLNLYKSVINLKLPLDLNTSNIDKLLKFRNENKDKIISFNKIILELKNSENLENDIKVKIDKINDEYLKKIMTDSIVLAGKSILTFLVMPQGGLAVLGSLLSSIDNILNIQENIETHSRNDYLNANSYLVNLNNL